MKNNWLRELDIEEQERDQAVLKQVMPSVYELLDTLTLDNPKEPVLSLLLKSILSFFINEMEMTETSPEHFGEALDNYFKATDQALPEQMFLHEPKEFVYTSESIGAFYKLRSVIDWKLLTPMVFSTIFESVLESKERRNGGMYYTSADNIHKVIDPLFLDDLTEELEAIKIKPLGERKKALQAFREKIGKLKFLDPACGSGNFLFTVYQDLRRLENKAIEMEMKLDKALEFELVLSGLLGERNGN